MKEHRNQCRIQERLPDIEVVVAADFAVAVLVEMQQALDGWHLPRDHR